MFFYFYIFGTTPYDRGSQVEDTSGPLFVIVYSESNAVKELLEQFFNPWIEFLAAHPPDRHEMCGTTSPPPLAVLAAYVFPRWLGSPLVRQLNYIRRFQPHVWQTPFEFTIYSYNLQEKGPPYIPNPTLYNPMEVPFISRFH